MDRLVQSLRITGLSQVSVMAKDLDELVREILGVATSTAESGGRPELVLKDLLARGLNGVALVTSDAHVGLVERSARICPAPLSSVPDSLHGYNLMVVKQRCLTRH
jgi:transposase-like protein